MLRRHAIVLPCCVALAWPSSAAAAPAPVGASTPADEPAADEAPAVPATDASGDAAAPADEAAPVDPPPSAEADEPAGSVFAPTPPPVAGDGVPEAPLGPGVPGGYWDLDSRGREPPDGADEVLGGSIILPLGIISAGSSVATVWLSAPGHCQQRWASIGASPSHDQCQGLYAFGWVRLSYGALMVITGAALLGVGLHRRHKHAQWERGYARRPQIEPLIMRGGAGVSLTLRLGGRRRR